MVFLAQNKRTSTPLDLCRNKGTLAFFGMIQKKGKILSFYRAWTLRFSLHKMRGLRTSTPLDLFRNKGKLLAENRGLFLLFFPRKLSLYNSRGKKSSLNTHAQAHPRSRPYMGPTKLHQITSSLKLDQQLK